MEQRRRIFRIILIGFFVFMLIGTLASRAYDSVSVPKVLTAYPKRKSVETVIAGTGTVKENETAFVSVYPGLRVESVAVHAGSEVKTGDELFRFQTESILERKQELETDLREAELNLERLDISSESYAQVSQTELAGRELQLAQRRLAEGQEEYQEKWAQHLVDRNNLDLDYKKKTDLNDEELLMQQEQQMESAYSELRSARAGRDEQIQEASRTVEDLEAQIAAAEAGQGGGTGDISELKKQLERAKEDLEAVKKQWDSKIGDIRYRYENLELQHDRILNGETNAQAALREAYDAAVKQEDAAWAAEEEKLASLEQSVEDAQWNLQLAARQDEYTRLTADQKARLAQIDRQLAELAAADIKARIGELDGILASEGRVLADRDGTVIDQEITAGRTSTGEERISLAYGSRIFEAEFDKAGQELSVGDLLSISVPGSSRTVDARITGMNLLGEETGVFWADLAELNLPIGTVTSYQCRKTSDTYQNVIPLEALRRDMNGYYCFAVRPRSGVMGEEFRAERIGLTVISQGDSEAAVEGALFDTDQLITAGNQVIAEGDRVRPVEELGK